MTLALITVVVTILSLAVGGAIANRILRRLGA